MTLSFSTVINGKPSYFIEKIWKALRPGKNLFDTDYPKFCRDYLNKFGKYWGDYPLNLDSLISPKLHTISLDEKSRWRAGMEIHMVVKPKGRFSAGFQFAPVIKCVSVQEIEIKIGTGTKVRGSDLNYGWLISHKVRDVVFYLAYEIYIDGNRLMSDQISKLAINDGFDSVEDFLAYFNKDFSGKLIHFTELKY